MGDETHPISRFLSLITFFPILCSLTYYAKTLVFQLQSHILRYIDTLLVRPMMTAETPKIWLVDQAPDTNRLRS